MHDKPASSTNWRLIAAWSAVIVAILSALILLQEFVHINPGVTNVVTFLLAVIAGTLLPIGLSLLINKLRKAPSPVENPTTEVEASPLEQDYVALPKIIVQAPPLTSPLSQWVRGDLIYELVLPDDIEKLQTILSKWKFVTSSPKQPSVAVANGIIGIGHNDGVTFNQAPVAPIDNCSMEFELQIIDHGNDQSNWAGVRVRAFDFCYDFRLGYLVYLRRSGQVELYGPEGIIDGHDGAKVLNTLGVWTHIRVDILGSEIRVYVNGEQEPHIRRIDKTFGGKGLIYLHTFGTHAQFRNLAIYSLTEQPAEERLIRTRRIK